MHIDLPITWYGTKESLDFDLDPSNKMEFQVTVTTKNIFQRAYTYLTGNEWSTTKKVLSVAELIKKVHIPDNLSAQFRTYSINNNTFKTPSYELFKRIFTDEYSDEDYSIEYPLNIKNTHTPTKMTFHTEDEDDAASGEFDILDTDRLHSTLWGFVSDVPEDNVVTENKYDSVKLESLRENVSKLIRLFLTDERLIIEVEGTDLAMLDKNDQPSRIRVKLGENLLNLGKDSLENLNNEELGEEIKINTEEALETMLKYVIESKIKPTAEMNSLYEVIEKGLLDTGLIKAFSLEKDPIEEPRKIEAPNKIYDVKIINILRRNACKYIDQAIKEINENNLESSNTFSKRLETTYYNLRNENNPYDVHYLVNDAYEDVLFFYMKNHLKPSKELNDLAITLKKNVHESGFADLRNVDF